MASVALAAFAPLVGRWTTSGSHPMLPGTLHGRTSFEWIEDGAFLLMRSEIDEPGVPTSVAIIGGDDGSETCVMLYSDERGVSRRCETTMRDGVWRWWRDAPGFSQRYAMTVSADGDSMVGTGELCRDGVSWERDLELTYRRV